MDLTQLFCDIDDFVKALERKNDSFLLISKSKLRRGFPPQMSLSELMTIIVLYHSSGYKNFKTFYKFIQLHNAHAFPKLISY